MMVGCSFHQVTSGRSLPVTYNSPVAAVVVCDSGRLRAWTDAPRRPGSMPSHRFWLAGVGRPAIRQLAGEARRGPGRREGRGGGLYYCQRSPRHTWREGGGEDAANQRQRPATSTWDPRNSLPFTIFPSDR